MIIQYGRMNLNILEKENVRLNHESGHAKYLHVSSQNAKLQQRIVQLEGQIISLKQVNQLLLNGCKHPLDPVVAELTRQIRRLEGSLAQLIRSNDQLQCDSLMKTQLLCENENEYREILNSYEEKIFELRTKCQSCEFALTQMQEGPPKQQAQEHGTSTRMNLMCFNEINELRMMLNRYNLENAELKGVIYNKEEQISQIKEQLNQYIKAGKVDHWPAHRQSLRSSTKIKQTQGSNNLNEQLSSHSQRSKIAAAIVKPSANPAIEINKLKALVIQYSQENINLKEQIKKLQKQISVKYSEEEQLKDSCRKLQQTIRNNKVEVEFYRNNFAELTKVTRERKIHYYEEFYDAQLPLLQRKLLYERERMINYWKDLAQMQGPFHEKLILNHKNNPIHHGGRNRSCPSKMHVRDSHKKSKICLDDFEQQSILGFVDQINDVQKYSYHLRQSNEHEVNSFQDAFSMIVKPTQPELMGKFSIRKSQFVTLEIDQFD